MGLVWFGLVWFGFGLGLDLGSGLNQPVARHCELLLYIFRGQREEHGVLLSGIACRGRRADVE